MRESEPAITDLVQDLINYFFDEADREEALFYLSQIAEEVQSSERIQIAAIRWTGGSLMKLASAVDQANWDWRDLLMGAGFGHDTKAHLEWAHDVLSNHR